MFFQKYFFLLLKKSEYFIYIYKKEISPFKTQIFLGVFTRVTRVIMNFHYMNAGQDIKYGG
jgi:hypothetical protein